MMTDARYADFVAYLREQPKRPLLTRLEAGEGLAPTQERHARALWEWIVTCQNQFGGVGLGEVKKIAAAHKLDRVSIAMALLIARKRLYSAPSDRSSIPGVPRRKGQLGYGLHTDAAIQAWRKQANMRDPFAPLV